MFFPYWLTGGEIFLPLFIDTALYLYTWKKYCEDLFSIIFLGILPLAEKYLIHHWKQLLLTCQKLSKLTFGTRWIRLQMHGLKLQFHLGTAKPTFRIGALLCYWDVVFSFLLLLFINTIHLTKRAHSKLKDKQNFTGILHAFRTAALCLQLI